MSIENGEVMPVKTHEGLCKTLMVIIFLMFLLDYSSLTRGIPRFKGVFIEHSAMFSSFTGLVFAASDFSRTILGGLLIVGLAALSIPLMKPDVLKIMNPKYLILFIVLFLIFNAYLFFEVLLPVYMLANR